MGERNAGRPYANCREMVKGEDKVCLHCGHRSGRKKHQPAVPRFLVELFQGTLGRGSRPEEIRRQCCFCSGRTPQLIGSPSAHSDTLRPPGRCATFLACNARPRSSQGRSESGKASSERKEPRLRDTVPASLDARRDSEIFPGATRRGNLPWSVDGVATSQRGLWPNASNPSCGPG